jgi:hypothetical protein
MGKAYKANEFRLFVCVVLNLTPRLYMLSLRQTNYVGKFHAAQNVSLLQAEPIKQHNSSQARSTDCFTAALRCFPFASHILRKMFLQDVTVLHQHCSVCCLLPHPV